MSWKEVLAFVDDSDAGLARLRAAVNVAARNGASLDALVLGIAPAPIADAEANVVEAELDEVRRAPILAAHRAADACRAITLPSGCAVSVETAAVYSTLVRAFVGSAARAADLVVLAQPRSDAEHSILIGALFGGGRPCLMLPQTPSTHEFGKKIFIAWKGVPEAARAVQGALPFLATAKSVRLCTMRERHTSDTFERKGVERLVKYLKRHDVNIEEPLVVESRLPEEPDETIFSEMDAFNADLLVMGAYHHARWNEFVFGGMTRRIIRDSAIPVLFSH